MKTLLAVFQLTVLAQVPARDAEKPAPTPPAEKKQVFIDFDDDSIELDLMVPPEPRCTLHRKWYPLVRIREDFADKVMQSVAEM
jgi:hypothetical protein